MAYKAITIIVILLFVITVGKAQTALEREWVREYIGDFEIQRAEGIAVDDSGNVFVGITSFDTTTDYGFTLIKYNPDGETQWIARYEDEDPESHDYLSSITVDHEGNAYLTGSSDFRQSEPFIYYEFYVTIKYNSNGEQEWLSTYRNDSINFAFYHSDLAVDSTGHVYVYIGGVHNASALIKYDSLGNELWVQLIKNNSLEVEFQLSQNSIFVGNHQHVVTKIDQNGNVIWNAEGDSLNIDIKNPEDIAVDSIGNVYITTFYEKGDNATDFLIAKFNSKGEFQWKKTYGGQSYTYYRNPHLCIDNNGFVYLGGYVYADITYDNQFIIIKYDSLGSELWAKNYSGPTDTGFTLWNFEIDGLNNLYLIGELWRNSISDYDMALMMTDSDGNLLFSDFYGTAQRNEKASRIAIDKNYNVYIAGDSYYRAKRVLTLKYRPILLNIAPNDYILPNQVELHQNYPNPFNLSTTISYRLQNATTIELNIYDVLGRKIQTLFQGQKQAG